MWAKKNKYNANISTDDDGEGRGSKLERAVRKILKNRQLCGEIKILKEQQHIHYYLDDQKICEYWPDFTCMFTGTNEIFFVEAKGYEKPEWMIKLNLWRYGGPAKLEIWKGSHKYPKLTEIVIPQSLGAVVRHDQVFGKLKESA